MAKKFGGFSPEQQFTLLGKMGYSGPKDQESMSQFLAATPSAAAKLGVYAKKAQERLNKVEMATGGLVDPTKQNQVSVQRNPPPKTVKATTQTKQDNLKTGLDAAKVALAEAEKLAANRPNYKEGLRDLEAKKKALQAAQTAYTTATGSTAKESVGTALTDPKSLITSATVDKITPTADQLIKPSVGKQDTFDKANLTTVGSTTTAVAPDKIDAQKVNNQTAISDVNRALDRTKAVAGEVSDQAQITAATQDPETLAQLDLQAAQLSGAQTVRSPEQRKLEAGEAIEGSAVDMQKVNEVTQVEAATAQPSKMATVAGQLEGLMTQFEGGATPAWAAGAMRAASAAMTARGLGASSMAGQAIVQAAMESAVPIAQADAETLARFESQNLSNKQQAVMFSAEQRAKFLGQDFDQKFQTKVLNAAKISEIANMNFTAEQQIALENARMAQSVDLANLDAKNAKIMADAAAMTQMDLTNLNNRQQAKVENAKSFLAMDMANLDNRQQTTLFKAQARINTLLSDTAAENATKQFNAASENQTNQFFAGLQESVSRFNADQVNTMQKFNTGEANALEQFNASQEAERDRFNATNSLVIAQANAAWRQNLSTINTAAQNTANLQAAQAATGLTQGAMDQLWQRERDLMSFAFTSSESALDRTLQLALGDKDIQKIKMQLDAEEDAGWGQLLGSIVGGWF